MPKANVALLFFIFLFLFIVSPAYATVINITASADSYVSEHYPTTNYGYTQNIWVITSNNTTYNSGDQYGYFMFDLSDIPSGSTIVNATLNLVQQTASTSGTYDLLVYNTTLSWNESNITWDTKPSNSVLQKNFSRIFSSGAHWWDPIEVTNAIQSALQSNKSSLMIRFDISNLSVPKTAAFYNASYGYTPGNHLNVNFISNASGFVCNTTTIGSYCDPNDRISEGGSGRIIITSPDYSCLNDIIYQCPVGDICSQITPQADIFTPITEYNVGCGVCWFVHTTTGQGTGLSLNCPASKGFTPACIWTNCPNNPECECAGVACNSQDSAVQNITSIPATSLNYTAGCFNPLTGAYDNAVLANGTNSTITDLSQEIFGNTTNLNKTHIYQNTSTTCFDAFGNLVPCAGGNQPPGAGICTSTGDQAALAIGGLMGISDCKLSETLIAMLVSMVIGFALLFYTRNDGHGGQAFIFGTLITLVMFTVIGWFYSWLMVILIVLGGYLVARSLGLGGG